MSRGKEYKGQTLVIDGSRSGASTVVTRLAYDSAFNLELIGEARYGSREDEQYWYIEKLSYDSAFNLTTVQTAQNVRSLGSETDRIFNGPNFDRFIITIVPNSSDPPEFFFKDIKPGDVVNFFNRTATIVENLGNAIRLDNPVPIGAFRTAEQLDITLNDYTTKDFNKRTWDYRNFYVYE